MAGMTPQGLVIRTQPELQALFEAALAAALPGVNVRAGPLQQFVGIVSEELAIAWEALQAVDAAFDPDRAGGVALDRLLALTGTLRREATRSRVTAQVNLNAGTTLSAGAIAAVAGNPDAQFRLTADVTNPGGSPANVDAIFEGVDPGPFAAPGGTLTVIVTPQAGWNAITNADDAQVGLALATDPEARVQRVVELAGSGAGPVDAIRASLAKVTGVLSVTVNENVTLTTDGNGLPGKAFEAVVWDGAPAGADDDALAQAIWDHKPAGIQSRGASTDQGTATDSGGATHVVHFTRAAKLRVYVDCTVVLAPGTATGWETLVEQAVAARADQYAVGETAYASQLVCAILDAVPTVVAVTALTLGNAPAPVGASVVPTYAQIVRVAVADVTPTT